MIDSKTTKTFYFLNDKEQAVYDEWKKSLPQIKTKKFAKASYWYKFTDTAIGTHVMVGRGDIPKHDKDITDYGSW